MRRAPGARIPSLAAVLVLGTLLPTAALACPSCAGREDGGTARTVALGLMMLFPFVLTALVVPVLKRPPRPAGRE